MLQRMHPATRAGCGGRSMTEAGRRTSKLDGIQVLRGFSASIIVFGHMAFEFTDWFGGPDQNVWFREISQAGVDIFFVVSGFVMVLVSQGRFGDRSYVLEFLSRRAIRIVPVYWFFLTAMVALFVVAPTVAPQVYFSAPYAALSYLFVPIYTQVGYHPVLGVGWTLNYEVFFYLVFGLLVVLSKWRAVAALWIVLIGFCLARLAFIPMPPTPTETFYVSPIGFWGDPIVLEFASGALLGALYSDGFRLARRWGWFLSVAAIGLFAVAFPLHDHGVHRAFTYGIPAALTVCMLTIVTSDKLTAFQWPQWSVRLGDISYSLYLSHIFVVGTAGFFIRKLGLGELVPWPVLAAAIYAVAIVVATVSYYLIERPLIQAAQARRSRSKLEPKAAS